MCMVDLPVEHSSRRLCMLSKRACFFKCFYLKKQRTVLICINIIMASLHKLKVRVMRIKSGEGYDKTIKI